MNILFITLVDIKSVNQRNLYADLIRQLSGEGHDVYVISPAERRQNIETTLIKETVNSGKDVHILKLKTGNIQKTNIIEKGISTLLLEHLLARGIKKYLSDVRFDLVLYSTPPVTLIKPIMFVKKRDKAQAYLMLKDIFPQNAVDIGMMKKSGVMAVLYKHFRRKEKKLYAISDRIGCMSQANVDYILQNNPQIDPAKIEICPNAIEVLEQTVEANVRQAVREKYAIPQDKRVFVYGGNLGRPQGIGFLIQCLEKLQDHDDAYVLIVGDGTEFRVLKNWFETVNPSNMQLMSKLPKEDYEHLVSGCDVGLIFLDHRFTIPNFPSRLLSYMQAKQPVIACTDPNTDVGKVITEGGFGWWCESNSADDFVAIVNEACKADLAPMGEKGFAYLEEHYSVEKTSQVILKGMK